MANVVRIIIACVCNKVEHAIDGDTALYDVRERELPWTSPKPRPLLDRLFAMDNRRTEDILLINSPPLSHQSTIAFHLCSCPPIFFNTPSIRPTTSKYCDQFSQERNKIENLF